MTTLNKIYLVGSGPSLKETPIDDLDGDIFTMNKWGRIASQLGFTKKPKYYLKIDHNTVDMCHKEEIQWAVENCEHLFLWEQFKTGYPKGHPNFDTMPDGVGELANTTWLKKCKHTPYQWDNTIKAVQSWHLPELCTAFGGMSTMIQIASTLGYDEIHLLGCDLGYTNDVNKNHAIPAYTKDKRDKSEMDDGNMTTLHKMAKRCCPIPIFNATIGGKLEVYPRVSL